LIYLGDEIATLNDYTYQSDPVKAHDSRWVHRPHFDWTRAKKRTQAKTAEGHIFQGLKHIIKVRKATPEFAGGQATFIDSGNEHVLSYVRNDSVLVLANFSDHEQTISLNTIRTLWPRLVTHTTNLMSGQAETVAETLVLTPHAFLWLKVG
jgi:amylosucrase